MSIQSVLSLSTPPHRPALQLLKPEPIPALTATVRLAFWIVGILVAAGQAWVYRFKVTPDSISYLDMSDGVLPGGDWHRLINGVWSPLYPFLVGLARRIFLVPARNEIAAAHVLNIGFFIFAFVCFDFFLFSATNHLKKKRPAEPGGLVLAPRWAYLSVAYSLFLWASISGISLRNLRPDMLMSGFLYLAVGILLRMQGAPARWKSYLALGAVLGFGFLAKAPMLPIGVLILATTLFEVEAWRPAIKMVAAAFALMMVMGGLYFIPLSRARGHLTLGESSGFNYLVDVDLARPGWYLQDAGRGRGSFSHSPERIFSSPPAYAFELPYTVTHPLRFDPSSWIQGVRARFLLRRQFATFVNNFLHNRQVLLVLGVATCITFIMAYRSRGRDEISLFRGTWPIWVIGLAGCCMYALLHIEARYVAAFLVLFWCGMIFSIRFPHRVSPYAVTVITLAVAASLLLPMSRLIYLRYSQGMGKINADGVAATELERLGIHPGDQVARISALGSDLGIERIVRAEVIAEVDLDHAVEFWISPITTQQALLQIFAGRGVKAVIATSPRLTAENQSEWNRLGSTQYWVWRPTGQ
jgi:hypothetical protein